MQEPSFVQQGLLRAVEKSTFVLVEPRAMDRIPVATKSLMLFCPHPLVYRETFLGYGEGCGYFSW
jgi:hypothetical protein